MTSNELRSRIDNDIHPVLDWPQENRRHDRVVADRRKMQGMGRVSDLLKIRNIIFRVPDALKKHAAGILVCKFGYLLGLIHIKEPDFDPEILEGRCKERHGPTIESG